MKRVIVFLSAVEKCADFYRVVFELEAIEELILALFGVGLLGAVLLALWCGRPRCWSRRWRGCWTWATA